MRTASIRPSFASTPATGEIGDGGVSPSAGNQVPPLPPPMLTARSLITKSFRANRLFIVASSG